MYQEMCKHVQCENTGGVWLWTRGDSNESIESARYSAKHETPTGVESDDSVAKDIIGGPGRERKKSIPED